MPIYEYRCSACAFQKEYLQKLSDPLLKVCPECGKETFGKMLTAAGFQLKGGGWYATDFKNSGAKPAAKSDAKPDAKTDSAGDAKTDAKTDTPSKTETTAAPAPAAAATPTPAATTATK